MTRRSWNVTEDNESKIAWEIKKPEERQVWINEFIFGHDEFETVWGSDGGCLGGSWLYKPETLRRDLANI